MAICSELMVWALPVIVVSFLAVGLRSVNVLLGGVPEHIDLYALCADIEDVPGVTLIHDVHVFTVTSNFDLMTAHVLVDPAFKGYEDEMQRQLRRIATDGYGIHHVTFQLCHSAEECSEDHHVGHLSALSRSPG